MVRGLPRLKFEKDHICFACQLGKSKKYTHKPKSENTIIKVKFLRSKDETLEFVIKFLKQIQVGLNKTVRFIQTDNGTEFVNQVLTKFYESVSITHQKSVLRTPQQNGVVERWNRTLVEAARKMLIFSKALMFLWAEVVATTCYTQNKSLIHSRHNKTPYELVHGKKPDLTFLCVFGALCYPKHDNEDLGKLKAKEDIRIFIGLVPNLVPASPYVPPTNKDREILFQPMFNEYFDPPSVERPVPPALAVQVLVVSAITPSSTTIDQDAPSTTGPTFEDNPFAQANNDLFVNPFAPEPSSEESSLRDVNTAVSNQVIQPHDHIKKWTKDHPMDNVIVKPKNFKTVVTEPCWFKVMQKEIHKFDRLQVWELVPKLDCVMIIDLKWIYKVKLDEYEHDHLPDGCQDCISKWRVERRSLRQSTRVIHRFRSSYTRLSSEEGSLWLKACSTDMVRILQKSQENGQNRTNTNTGTDRVYKSRETKVQAGRFRRNGEAHIGRRPQDGDRGYLKRSNN
ncbi:retrovirus-related pol polyprotein from transposon TNT 1-94 [Tanacetum coccineum]